MEKICVLMSTYNGEKYLEEQLDSIIAQKYVVVDLYIRDDGSTDKTKEILLKYSKRYQNIKVSYGENMRSAQSFMELLYSVNNYKYYAFADQDDVWLPQKLINGIKKLKDEYHLYCCKKEIVNEKLIRTGKKDEKITKISLGNSILKCKVSGCTMIFDDILKEKINEYRPKNISMHDSWVLKVACCIGKVYYDNKKNILYRQHSKNVVGSKKNLFIRWMLRIKNFTKRKKNLTRIEMAKELHLGYAKYLSTYEAQNLKFFAYSREKKMYRLKIIISDFLNSESYFELFSIKCLILLGII